MERKRDACIPGIIEICSIVWPTEGASLIHLLLSELKNFTGEGWEQEDDVTMVTLQRTVLQTPGHSAQILAYYIPTK